MKFRSRRMVRRGAVACCLSAFFFVLVLDRAAGQLGKPVRLSGYATDQSSGAPIPGTYVDIQDDKNQHLIGATTNSSGFYDIEAPWSSAMTA